MVVFTVAPLRHCARRGATGGEAKDDALSGLRGCIWAGCLLYFVGYILIALLRAAFEWAGDADWSYIAPRALAALLVVGIGVAVIWWVRTAMREAQRRQGRTERLRDLIQRARQRRARGSSIEAPAPQGEPAADAPTETASASPAMPTPVPYMQLRSGTTGSAPPQENGSLCPVCQSRISPGDSAIVCPACRTTHHQECWEYNGGCAIYGCRYEPQG